MKKLAKVAAPFIGGILLVMLLISNGALVMATPPPPEPAEPTTCAECQDEQNEYDAAYAELEAVIGEITVQTTEIEEMLNLLDPVDIEIALSDISEGELCQDSADLLPYYSSFEYDETLYCFADPAQYEFFFNHMADVIDPANAEDWNTISDTLIYLIMDDDIEPNDVEDLINSLEQLKNNIEECENIYCSECPDCETIVGNMEVAYDDLDALEAQADLLDAEVTDLEVQIEDIWDTLNELEELRNDFRQMVLDAGGMVDGDCDGFTPESGQAWGIAHTFGDVQWCLTSESQIEDMISNLDEYWQTNSSSKLPSEEELNEQADILMNSYIDKLYEYEEVLSEIELAYTNIAELIQELEDCIEELQALQDMDLCLDQDIPTLQAILDNANDDIDSPYEPSEPETEPETEPEGFDDTEGHWAEDFIIELKDAGVVAGDPDTNNFRPNDNINRAESSKIVILANEDTPAESFFDVFTDVLEESWYWPFVNIANEMGYFEGYEDGTFAPGNSILRAEAAAVVLRVAGFEIPEYETYSFPDIEGDEWYADYAERAYQCGIFEGRLEDEEQVFAGAENITRAEFSKIVNLTIFNEMSEDSCNEV